MSSTVTFSTYHPGLTPVLSCRSRTRSSLPTHCAGSTNSSTLAPSDDDKSNNSSAVEQFVNLQFHTTIYGVQVTCSVVWGRSQIGIKEVMISKKYRPNLSSWSNSHFTWAVDNDRLLILSVVGAAVKHFFCGILTAIERYQMLKTKKIAVDHRSGFWQVWNRHRVATEFNCVTIEWIFGRFSSTIRLRKTYRKVPVKNAFLCVSLDIWSDSWTLFAIQSRSFRVLHFTCSASINFERLEIMHHRRAFGIRRIMF